MSSASRRRRRRLEMSECSLSVAHDDGDTGVRCRHGHRRAGREEQRRRQSWGQIAVSRKFMPWRHETQCRRSAAIVPFAISAARSPWSSSLTFVWAIRSLARSLTRSVPSIHAYRLTHLVAVDHVRFLACAFLSLQAPNRYGTNYRAPFPRPTPRKPRPNPRQDPNSACSKCQHIAPRSAAAPSLLLLLLL
jgi:hypothetical protein